MNYSEPKGPWKTSVATSDSGEVIGCIRKATHQKGFTVHIRGSMPFDSVTVHGKTNCKVVATRAQGRKLIEDILA